MGSCVYNGGNLMLESTGRPRKYRIYEMSTNKTPRATVAYLIVRDEVHEKVDAKALESFGADWGKSLPIPSFGREQVPRGAGAPRPGIGDGQWTFRLDGSRAGEVLHGNSPLYDGPTARTADRPEQGFAIPQAPERPEEFAPGLTPELMGLTQAAAALATKGTTFSGPGMSGAVGTAKVLGKVRTDGTETPLKGGDHIEVSRGEAWTTTMRTKK